MTLDDFCLHLSAAFSLNNTAATEERGLMEDWVNEAVLQYLMDTHCHISAGTISLVAGTSDYAAPSNALAIHQLWITGYDPLEQLAAEEITALRRTAGAEPLRFFALDGDFLMIYPTPTANSTLNTLYVPVPTEMTTGSHDPSNNTYGGIPKQYHPTVELWAMGRAGDQQRDSSSNNGLNFFAQYETQMKKDRARQRRMASKRLPRARVGYPGWRGLPHDNSQDIVHR